MLTTKSSSRDVSPGSKYLSRFIDYPIGTNINVFILSPSICSCDATPIVFTTHLICNFGFAVLLHCKCGFKLMYSEEVTVNSVNLIQCSYSLDGFININKYYYLQLLSDYLSTKSGTSVLKQISKLNLFLSFLAESFGL